MAWNSTEDFKITVNKDFAEKLQKQKEKVELNQLKEKFGDEFLDDESESSSCESEDEDGREVTAEKEKDFLTVLSMIKNKDPKIYSKNVNFYHEDEDSSSSEESNREDNKHTKPLYLKDFERKMLLEKGSEAFLSDEEIDEDKMHEGRASPTFVEEQKQLKESLKKAIQDDDNDEENFLKVREKTANEKAEEEREYVEWLKGQQNLKSAQPPMEMDALRRYWTDPALEEGEQFLRDYILDRNYIDKDFDRIPTYDEIVAEGEDEDESEVDKEEEFERKYNFRFEEPDAEFIKTYPRTIQGSVRKTDDRRKEKRKERELKKEKEKEQKREEIKRLKNLKRKEIMEKLEKLKAITGNPNVGFKEEDIDGDFDPKKYDEAMQNAFDEEFYDECEEEKPEFDNDLDDEMENWDEWEGNYEKTESGEDQQGSQELHCEDPGFNMDADYDESQAVDLNMPSRRKRKGRSRFASAVNQEKPVFDPDEKTFEQYFDEYYKLDYEDIIGDMPCRYNYRQVVPNDFGISTEEILTCPDRELNMWVSVKKMSLYRPQTEEYEDIKKFRKRGRDWKRKNRILSSLIETESPEEEIAKKKRVSQNGLSERGKTHKTRHDNVKTEIEHINNEAETPNHSSDTLNGGETISAAQDSDVRNAKKTNELKSRKYKEVWDKQKGKSFKKKGKRLTFEERKEQALRKRLRGQFRGAKKEPLANLSAARLASYGLTKKKRKK